MAILISRLSLNILVIEIIALWIENFSKG